jgi:anti-sigma regulatory factor (Ser/Thr protein kinase)
MRSLPGARQACLVHRMTLPAAAVAASIARRATRRALDYWGLNHLTEDAVLLVSELVGNAVRHATNDGSDLELELAFAGTVLRIEVRDADPRSPHPRAPAGLDESGFGFVLVEALASEWGVTQTGNGKAVWAELSTRSGAAHDDSGRELNTHVPADSPAEPARANGGIPHLKASYASGTAARVCHS